MVRIIDENRLAGTRAARYALSVGMITDATAWSVVVALATIRGAHSTTEAVTSIAVTMILAASWYPLQRMLAAALRRINGPTAAMGLACLCAGLGVAAAMIARLDPILGALGAGMMFGAARSRAGQTKTMQPLRWLAQTNAVILLPLFFAAAGLSVRVVGSGWNLLSYTIIGTALAILVRITATMGVARWTNLRRDEARTICALVCARGATELAILKVGANLGLLPEILYTPLVLMTLFTTALSGLATRPGSWGHGDLHQSVAIRKRGCRASGDDGHT
jgi:Kef-type K+ transport system membrane component KefB